MPQWLGKPPRPPCQHPLHTSCDPTRSCRCTPHQSKAHSLTALPTQRAVSAMLSRKVSTWATATSSVPLSILSHQGCSPGGPAKRPPGQARQVLLTFLRQPLCSFQHPVCLKSLPPLGFLRPSQPPFQGLPPPAAHSRTPGRIPTPGRDDSYSLLRSLGFLPALHSCSSQGNERL